MSQVVLNYNLFLIFYILKESCHANATVFFGSLSSVWTLRHFQKLNNLGYSALIALSVSNAMAGEEANKAPVYPICHPEHSNCSFLNALVWSWERKFCERRKIMSRQHSLAYQYNNQPKNHSPFTIWMLRNLTTASTVRADPHTVCSSQERPRPPSSMPTISTKGSLGWQFIIHIIYRWDGQDVADTTMHRIWTYKGILVSYEQMYTNFGKLGQDSD